MKKEIYIDDIIKEIKELEKEYKVLIEDYKEYGNNCYATEDFDRRIEIIRRLKILKTL